MPSSTPTIRVRAPEWLPDEYIEILTYAGAGANGAIADAMVVVSMDPSTRQVTGGKFAPEAAATERRRQAIKGWQLFEEKENGVAGPAIPLTAWNIDNLDPAYAQWLDARIREEWAKWAAVTRQDVEGKDDKEVARKRRPFQEHGASAPGRREPEDGEEEEPA